MLPNEATITLIPNPARRTHRKLQTNISDDYRYENPKRNTSKSHPAVRQKNNTSRSSGAHSRGTGMFQHGQINQ